MIDIHTIMVEIAEGRGDTDPTAMASALASEILRLRAELAALREPAGDALVEVAARALYEADPDDYDDDLPWEACGSSIHDDFRFRARAALAVVLPRVRAQASAERDKLMRTLDGIGRLAMGCWMNMRGELIKDACRRAHDVLAQIAKEAYAALPPPPDAAPDAAP